MTMRMLGRNGIKAVNLNTENGVSFPGING